MRLSSLHAFQLLYPASLISFERRMIIRWLSNHQFNTNLMEALIQRQIMPHAVLPALRRMSEVGEVSHDPRVDLLHGQRSRGRRLDRHEDEARERVGGLRVRVGGRGGRRLARRAGGRRHSGHGRGGFCFSLWAK